MATAPASPAALHYQQADAPVLAAALGSYGAVMRWNLTCIAASAAERELAARNLVALARLARAMDEPEPDLSPMSDAERRRCAASGVDPYVIEALFDRERIAALRGRCGPLTRPW